MKNYRNQDGCWNCKKLKKYYKNACYMQLYHCGLIVKEENILENLWSVNDLKGICDDYEKGEG